MGKTLDKLLTSQYLSFLIYNVRIKIPTLESAFSMRVNMLLRRGGEKILLSLLRKQGHTYIHTVH